MFDLFNCFINICVDLSSLVGCSTTLYTRSYQSTNSIDILLQNTTLWKSCSRSICSICSCICLCWSIFSHANFDSSTSMEFNTNRQTIDRIELYSLVNFRFTFADFHDNSRWCLLDVWFLQIFLSNLSNNSSWSSSTEFNEYFRLFYDANTLSTTNSTCYSTTTW